MKGEKLTIFDTNEHRRDNETAVQPYDEYSFELFYKRLYPRLCTFSFMITGSRAASEDIVQEVFLSIWHRRNVIQINNSIDSYIIRSVYNLSLRYVHCNSRNESITDVDINDPDATPIDGLYVDLSDEQLMRITKLNMAIEELPTQCRTVFLMNKREGMSQRQIAGSLGISIKTVDNHIVKAVRLIRRFIKK